MKIKKLKWHKTYLESGLDDHFYWAEPIKQLDYGYHVEVDFPNKGQITAYFNGEEGAKLILKTKNLEEAKSFCQQHFERKIKSCLIIKSRKKN